VCPHRKRKTASAINTKLCREVLSTIWLCIAGTQHAATLMSKVKVTRLWNVLLAWDCRFIWLLRFSLSSLLLWGHFSVFLVYSVLAHCWLGFRKKLSDQVLVRLDVWSRDGMDLGTDSGPHPVHCGSTLCRSIFVDRHWSKITNNVGNVSPLIFAR